MEHDTSLDDILEYLRDPEAPIEPFLAHSLTHLDADDAQRFVDSLNEIDEERRHELYRVVGKTASEDFAVDLLRVFAASLHHDDPIVRAQATRGLWDDPKPYLVKQLVHALKHDPDTDVRSASASTLGRYVWEAECEELPAEIGDMVRKALEEAIRSNVEELEVRRHAVEAIAFINDDKVRHIIDVAYDDDELKMQVSAVFAMGRSADTRWAPQVMRELASNEPELRFEATRAAGEMQLRDAVNALAYIIETADGDLRLQAIWSLGQIGGEAARNILTELCEFDDAEVAEVAEAAETALEECDFADMVFDMMVVDEDTDLREVDLDDMDLDDDEYDEDDDQDWDDDVITLN